MNQTMQAYHYSAAGGPEVIRLTERDKPVPQAGEVLIKIHAFGLNRADVQQRLGVYPPPPGASDIPGLEVSGVVESLGADVVDLAVGQPVAALLAAGGYAQYAAVPRNQLMALPESLDLTSAAGLMETSCTVISNLFIEAGLSRGQNLLIHGGAGGIGSMAIQLAKRAGANVLVTASSAEKLKHCSDLGADVTINYREEDFVERVHQETSDVGSHVILDVVGAKYLDANVRALAVGGRLVVIGLQGGAKAELNLGMLMGKRARVIGTTLRARPAEEKARIVAETEQRIRPLLADGSLDLVIDRAFSFDQLAAAHEYFDSGQHRGKIVVTT